MRPIATRMWRAWRLRPSRRTRRMFAPDGTYEVSRRRSTRTTRTIFMPSAIIDGIDTCFDVIGSGPPLLMMSPGGFDATIEKWRTQGVYTRLKLLDHIPRHFTCIVYDRRESGESGGRGEHITWAHYGAQAKGLLHHLRIQRAHVM